MISESQILTYLDNSNETSTYSHFISLGHPYSYLIDSRLNIFRGNNDRWAIVAERLGFNERSGAIELEINYHGNCLLNLEGYNGKPSNYYILYPIAQSILNETADSLYLNGEKKCWIVKGVEIVLSNNRRDYSDNGIELNEYEPRKISIQEAIRLAIVNFGDLFRANDDELYKSIPKDLKKILVLNEWYHKDFNKIDTPIVSDEHLKYTYEFNKNLTGLEGLDFESFANMFRAQELLNNQSNKKEWINNRPSSYETWNQLAKVIVTGDTSFYKPTIPSNTHWKNWPESGSL